MDGCVCWTRRGDGSIGLTIQYVGTSFCLVCDGKRMEYTQYDIENKRESPEFPALLAYNLGLLGDKTSTDYG
jgi:hypothetical protein